MSTAFNSSLIPFNISYNCDGERIYSTPYNTRIYEEYTKSQSTVHVVLVDLYSEGTTMPESGTQAVNFIRVRFANIRPYSESWFTVGITPTHTSIPSPLTDEERRELKLQLLHRFIFVMFK